VREGLEGQATEGHGGGAVAPGPQVPKHKQMRLQGEGSLVDIPVQWSVLFSGSIPDYRLDVLKRPMCPRPGGGSGHCQLCCGPQPRCAGGPLVGRG